MRKEVKGKKEGFFILENGREKLYAKIRN